MKKIFIIILLLAVSGIILTVFEVQAKYSLDATDYPAIGGTKPTTDLVSYLHYFYLFGLALVGLAGLGALVYGGFIYMLSETITSKEDAKRWIWGAIGGIILALAAFLILWTINPALVTFQIKLPDIPNSSSSNPSGSSDACAGVTCTGGRICQAGACCYPIGTYVSFSSDCCSGQWDPPSGLQSGGVCN